MGETFPANAHQVLDIMAPPATPHPIGTVSELIAVGINPQRYGSCAPPDNSDTAPVRGCSYARSCRFSFKFKSGPQNGAVLTVASSGGRDIIEMPCFHYMSRLTDKRLSGEGFEWIASEGEEFLAKTSKESIVGTTAKGPKIHVKLFRERRVVAAFPRPHENPMLADEIANVEIGQYVAEREDNRRRTSTLGMSDPKLAMNRKDEYDRGTTMETVSTGQDGEEPVRKAGKPKALTVAGVKKDTRNAKADAKRLEDIDSEIPELST